MSRCPCESYRPDPYGWESIVWALRLYSVGPFVDLRCPSCGEREMRVFSTGPHFLLGPGGSVGCANCGYSLSAWAGSSTGLRKEGVFVSSITLWPQRMTDEQGRQARREDEDNRTFLDQVKGELARVRAARAESPYEQQVSEFHAYLDRCDAEYRDRISSAANTPDTQEGAL
jgi:ribosomal protein S27E